MSLLTKFQYFPRLPMEIQNAIWEFYRNQRGLRHYITVAAAGRFYAAINIDTGKFIHTYIHSVDVIPKMMKRWPRRHPAHGEKFEIIRLVGEYFIPEPGTFAKSIVSAKDNKMWSKMIRLRIRINFRKDLVFLDGGYTHVGLRPLWPLNRLNPLLHPGHWFKGVRHLAIQLRLGQIVLDDISIKAIRSLRWLENIYLIVYRDPHCVYGAPRNWRDFNKGLMDGFNFLGFEEFTRRHPKDKDIKCSCGKTSQGAERILGELTKNMNRYWDRHVSIKIAVDPY